MSAFLRNGIPRKENGKIDLSWKNHYGFTGLIWILGWFVPPLAVAIRFGIGKDFLINVVLTICGYIPGHLHNWFIQNVRNNESKGRTPKWAIRYGLVDDRASKKLAKSRVWTARYNDRLPQRVVYDDDGRAHVIAEENNGTAAPIQPQSTGLVEEDRWINTDPSSTFQRTSSMQSVDASASPTKSKGMSRFFKSSPASRTTSGAAEQRRSSITERHTDMLATSAQYSRNSSSSSLRSGPEDPTRQYGRRQSSSSRTKSSGRAPPSRQTQQHDVFAHEF